MIRWLGAFFLMWSTQVFAATFSLPDGSVSFDAPEGFSPLAEDEISFKYPAARAPSFVVGNTRRATTIAWDLKPHELPDNQLDEARLAFEAQFSRMIPGIEWKENRLIELAGRRWILLEMTSHAVDTDIWNIMLMTGHNGQMLVFNFNSTRAEFPEYEAALRSSMDSIRFD